MLRTDMRKRVHAHTHTHTRNDGLKKRARKGFSWIRLNLQAPLSPLMSSSTTKSDKTRQTSLLKR